MALQLLLALVVGYLSLKPLRGSGEIFSLRETTKLKGYENLTFFIRLPKSVQADSAPKKALRKQHAVRGVLALCTHRTEPGDVKKNITKNGRFKPFLGLADEYNLALVTWTNFKGYLTNISGDEMDREEYLQYDKNFDARAREWRNGYGRLCRKYDLPKKNGLMYGVSGGGQMAHRLALRMPEYFFAVHIHINSSYDQIKKDGNQILWLVTTGTREYGYPAGVRFYRNALEAGYYMIFRAEENLGHSDSPGTRAMGMAFWKYCLKFLPDATDPEWRPPPVDRFYLMRYPTYIGDYLNMEAFKSQVAPKHISPEVMVALPSQSIAEAWGTIVTLEE